MKRGLWFLVIILLGLGLIVRICFPTSKPTSMCKGGIVSLAPNCTETCYALHLENQLIAVDSFSRILPEASHIQRLNTENGYPDYEKLLQLSPNLILLPQSSQDIAKKLNELGLKTLLLPHNTLEDIIISLQLVATATQQTETAKSLIQTLTQQLKPPTIPVPQYRALFCISRDFDSVLPRHVYIAGNENFFTPLMALAGIENVASRLPLPYPMISCEQIIDLNPDIIIELCPLPNASTQSLDSLRKPWQQLSQLKAVKNNQIYIFTNPLYTVPGPTVLQLLQQLQQLTESLTEQKPHD